MCTSASEARSQSPSHGEDEYVDIAEQSTILYPSPEDNTYMNPIIYDAVQQLDKKFDIIDRKLSKIERSRTKYSWSYRRPLGHSRKHPSSQVSNKAKSEEMEMSGHCSSFSHSESYSPISPVRRPQNTGDRNNVISSFHYEVLPGEMETLQEREQYTGSPAQSIFSGGTHHDRMTSDDIPAPQLLCSPRFPDNATFSVAVSPIAPAAPLTQREPSLTHTFAMGSPEREPTRSSFRNTSSFATSSPIETNAAVRRLTLPDDPVNWSVEDVILFLNHTDPKISDPLNRLLRKHEIDGKALLLLDSEVVMKHMGLKLGPSLKLCHYIEKLKDEKS
ncbi:sex comb on midleg-like protein 1 isoform X2 [Cavia porcellus]|uniref:sex comb on midleg-like protein 1 isoform X2 n=2 Tax=Cavia porcellus TaxID=10141 RepID=UPI002FE19F66